MILYTEIVGGPEDGELISTWNKEFDALPEIKINYLRGQDVCPSGLAITRYRKCKAFYVFNNKYYFREFFVRDSSDQDQAIKIFRNYFNPVYKK